MTQFCAELNRMTGTKEGECFCCVLSKRLFTSFQLLFGTLAFSRSKKWNDGMKSMDLNLLFSARDLQKQVVDIESLFVR